MWRDAGALFVATYRLYLLNSAGHVRESVVLDCESDAEALRVAEGHRGPAMELWNLDRLVKQFETEF